MKLKNVILLGLLALASFPIQAQDLINKVPRDANALLTFDTQTFFSLIPTKEINTKLGSLGMFERLNELLSTSVSDVGEMGFDLQSKSYLYVRKTDSITFVGGLIPLNSVSKFKNLLTKDTPIITLVDGLETAYTADNTIRLSWDESTLYILSGHLDDTYFNDPDVRSAFGLSELAFQDYDYYDADVDTAYAWESTDFDIEDETVFLDTAITLEEEWEDIDTTDWAMENEESWSEDVVEDEIDFEDDSYLESMRITSQDDSLKNKIKELWINKEMAKTLSGNHIHVRGKSLLPAKLKKNVVANLYIKDLSELYTDLMPVNMGAVYAVTGQKFDLGITSLSYDFIVDNNELKISGYIEVDDEMKPYMKDIYTSKINPKFLQYISAEDLGFFSMHFNTAAYINYIPAYLNRYKDLLGSRVGSFYEVGSVLFDVLLDEEAIAKVFKGDNLFVLNGLTQKEVTYVDYDYDEDYNATEVERKKMETVPSFLYMFGSDDQRLFQRLLQLGISQEEVSEHNGVYTIKTDGKIMPEIYVVLHKGIIFVGNDLAKITAIQTQSFRNKPIAKYSKMIKKNNLAAVFSLNKVPDMLKNLGMPIPLTMKQSVESLAAYGDVSITSTNVKGNKLSSELSIAFPKEQNNALNYLFNYITTLIGSEK